MAKQSKKIAQPLWLVVLISLLAGCQQKMANQPSYKPLDANPFYKDNQSARPLVPGTLARGHLHTDLALFTGKTTEESRDWSRAAVIVGTGHAGGLGAAVAAVAEQADYVDTFPFPITREVLQHGHDRFMIYCVVCHDALGTGRGKIVERGYTPPPSYHIERLRQVPVGHFFDVITRGYGSMPSYGEQIPPRDRWAIAAYIRALQLSQHFPEKQLTEQMRAEWKHAGRPPTEGR
ncbi:MAG TPA: cytochrome c [Gemmataceae bacterium]|nr:cytochrome c [Gemmataceae bacterium]